MASNVKSKNNVAEVASESNSLVCLEQERKQENSSILLQNPPPTSLPATLVRVPTLEDPPTIPSLSDNSDNELPEIDQSLLREICITREKSGKFGLVVGKSEGKLIIVCTKPNTAAKKILGLNFGDEIIKVGDERVLRSWSPRDIASLMHKALVCTIQILPRPELTSRHIITKSPAAEIGISFRTRVLTAVQAGSPADLGGLQAQQVIVTVNGRNVLDLSDLKIKLLIQGSPKVFSIITVPAIVYNDVNTGIPEKDLAKCWFDMNAPGC
eukprot:Awhi_evm1s15154